MYVPLLAIYLHHDSWLCVIYLSLVESFFPKKGATLSRVYLCKLFVSCVFNVCKGFTQNSQENINITSFIGPPPPTLFFKTITLCPWSNVVTCGMLKIIHVICTKSTNSLRERYVDFKLNVDDRYNQSNYGCLENLTCTSLSHANWYYYTFPTLNPLWLNTRVAQCYVKNTCWPIVFGQKDR